MKVPVCARCGRPVERFFRTCNAGQRWWRFIAECHGDRQSVVIDEEAIVDGQVSLTLVEAFSHAVAIVADRSENIV